MKLINNKYLEFERGTINMDNVMYIELNQEDDNKTDFVFVNDSVISVHKKYKDVLNILKNGSIDNDKQNLRL